MACVVGLVLVMAAVMGAFSTLTLRHTLQAHLDEQLEAASQRAADRRHDSGREPRLGWADTPSDAETRASGGDQQVPPGLDAPGQPTGTLSLIRSGEPSGTGTGGATVVAGYIDDDGTYRGLTSAEQDALLALEVTGEPVTVTIDSLGDYRVLVAEDEVSGDVVVTGLSMKGDNTLVRTQLLVESAIALFGALAVAWTGRAMVRASLGPLERVADTAKRVASQPLAHGEVSIDDRVTTTDLDSSQEVGQVGTALNTLLGHVDEALTARHRSETQVRQFVADASHELRTPLASIRGYTELIAREGTGTALPPEAAHALERVHSESVRMTALVEDLLLLARLDAGRELRHDEVDLVAVVVDTVSDARAAGPDHVWDLDLEALDAPERTDPEALDDFEPEPPIVLGDEARLRQVLVNLLANSRVHTPAGTHVTTTLSRLTGPAGDELVITIADDGPGIDPAVRDRLFERFARADASRERRTGSTGLGMSIALAIVQSHGGRLSVESRWVGESGGSGSSGAAGDPGGSGNSSDSGASEDSGGSSETAGGHGTTFTVTLPALPPQP